MFTQQLALPLTPIEKNGSKLCQFDSAVGPEQPQEQQVRDGEGGREKREVK